MTNPTFAHLHEKARDFIQGSLGKSIVQFAHKVEESVKGLLVPSVIFEELGLRYYGPIDGHDIPLFIRTFEFLKTQEEPVLLHILTKRAKGTTRPLSSPTNFTVSANTRSRAARPRRRQRRPIRKSLAKHWRNSRRPTRSSSQSRPRCRAGPGYRISPRRIRVGISTSGSQKNTPRFSPVGGDTRLAAVSRDLFHVFQRAYDMAIHDIAIQNLNVKLCMDRAGLTANEARLTMACSTSLTCDTSRTG